MGFGSLGRLTLGKLGAGGGRGGGGGGPALWSPAMEPAVDLWFDGRDSSRITIASDKVSQWQSLIGSVALANPSTANRPFLSTLNGFQSVGSDGPCSLVSGTVSFPQPFTMFSMMNFTSVTGTQTFFSNTWIANKSSGQQFSLYPGTTATISTETASIGTYITAHYLNNADSTIFLNGVELTLAPTPAGTAAGANFRIFATSNAGTNGIIGSFGEILLVSGSLDTTLRQVIEGYLAHRWAATANLPVDHPYKDAPPMTADGGEVGYLLIDAGGSPLSIGDGNNLSLAA